MRMRTGRWSRLVAVAILLAASVLGCGTTVPQDRIAAGIGGTTGLGEAPGGDGLGSRPAGSGGADPSSGGPGTGVDGPAVTPSVGAGGGSGRGASGPGVTGTTIHLGLGVTENQGAANEQAGVSTGSVDERRVYEILLEDLNARGGIGGRRALPVFHAFDTLSAQTIEQQDQAACETWTRDARVFATDGGLGSQTLMACLERAGVVSVYPNPLRPVDERFFARFPHYVQPSGIDLNELSRTYVQSMIRMRYFGDGPRVGLIAFDTPEHRHATAAAFLPALRQNGLDAEEVAYVTKPATFSQIGELSSQIAGVVLRFKTVGITHVLMLDEFGNIALLFMTAAERQLYHPRYGLTSLSGNSSLTTLLGPDDSRAQLRDALSIGWVPSVDVTQAHESAFARSSSRTRCLNLVRSKGVEISSRDNEEWVGELCETIWFIEASLEASGPVLNHATFLAGLDRLGAGYTPVNALRAAFGASRRDGASAVADLSFDQGCACFRYTSGARSLAR